jgi:hypothetical protein
MPELLTGRDGILVPVWRPSSARRNQTEADTPISRISRGERAGSSERTRNRLRPLRRSPARLNYHSNSAGNSLRSSAKVRIARRAFSTQFTPLLPRGRVLADPPMEHGGCLKSAARPSKTISLNRKSSRHRSIAPCCPARCRAMAKLPLVSVSLNLQEDVRGVSFRKTAQSLNQVTI